MSEYERETEFLRQVIRLDNTKECRGLDEKIEDAERDGRCMWRATWLVAMFAGAALAGIGYVATLEPSVPDDSSVLMMEVLCVIALASVISLLAFIGYLLACRTKLNDAREECRRVAMKLLEAHAISDSKAKG